MAQEKGAAGVMEKLVSLCKRRGFVYRGSEIYGGLAGTWDYGPLGVALKRNIEALWWRMFVEEREDMYGIDAAILMNPKVWEASGHLGGFSDPLVADVKTGKRYRADHLLEEAGVSAAGMTLAEMGDALRAHKVHSPEGNELSSPQQFNMMLKTHMGALEDAASVSYLRPETAGGIFVNFKNVVDSLHPKLPFGLAQIGKAFRNEIAPRDFLFRVRELEQMEIEYFVKPEEWEEHFERWREAVHFYIAAVGIDAAHVHECEVGKEDRAHYSARTIDFEFEFPFGRKELCGLAYRTDFDLKSHAAASGVDLVYLDEEKKEKIVPHVIEPSFGVGRTVLAVLVSAYREDALGGETRVYLALKPSVAPIQAAVFPLLKNKPELVAKAREVFSSLKKEIPRTVFDDNGNIGKRYRRQDEVGTPWCITVDFDTLKDGTVTLRDRDSGAQERVAGSALAGELKARMN